MSGCAFPVSVITTEINEAGVIGAFIEGLLRQTCTPDEIIICDGGSADGTTEVIQRYIDDGAPVRLIVKAGNRSVGRNEAVRQARNDVIACTDVGTVADPGWLEAISRPFRDDPTVMAVSGFFKARPESFFEEVSSSLMLTDHENIDLDVWLPSSRSVAFRKEAWRAAGGYPEYTSYNEDTPFDLNLRRAGYRFVFAPEALVYWRPRSDLRGFWRQYLNYAVGDGLDGIFAWNYIRVMLFYLALVVLLACCAPAAPILLAAYWLRRSRHMWRRPRPRWWFLLLPLVTVKDAADSVGYLRGRLLRRSMGTPGGGPL